MSLSGSVNGSTDYAGSSSPHSHLRVTWSASQSVSGNYSNVTAKLYLVISSGASLYATGHGYLTIDGSKYSFSHGTANWGAGSHLLKTASKRVYHSSNGTKTLSIVSDYDSGYSALGNLPNASKSWSLNTIDRYLSIVSWNLNTATDTSVKLYINPTGTADILDYSLNGSGWKRGYTGNFTSKTITIGGLKPGSAYTFKARVRNNSGGLYTNTGVKSASTKAYVLSSYVLSSVDDTTLQIDATSNYTSDRLEYKIGTGSWTVVPVSGTSLSTELEDLGNHSTYSVAVRARHKSSGVYTASITKTATTEDPTPLQPIDLEPAHGDAISNLEPTLSWQYMATSSDAQTAMQVVLSLQSTGATIEDTGKISSSSQYYSVPTISGLVFGSKYQWKVRTWGAADTVGPYSETVTFKESQPPTVTITSPATDASLATDVPSIQWDYLDPEFTQQSAYDITITSLDSEAGADVTTVYSRSVLSPESFHQVESGMLVNNTFYRVSLVVYDGDGIRSEIATETFGISFIAPTPPSGFAELSEDKLFTNITISTNNPEEGALQPDYIRVYKREYQADNDWTLLNEISVNMSYIVDTDFNDVTLEQNATALNLNNNSRDGSSSASLVGGAGVSLYSFQPVTTSVIDFDKMRVWVRAESVSGIDSVSFLLGTDINNHYKATLDVDTGDMNSEAWYSFEIVIAGMVEVGTPPALYELTWVAILVDANSAIADGELLIDGWRLVEATNSLFVYDYELNNNKTYEYGVSTYSSQETLESAIAVADEIIVVEYGDLLNTFLVPVGNESDAIASFMDGSSVPNWNTKTNVKYYNTVGARTPVAYSLSTQRYKKGEVELRFFDEKFEGRGLDGIDALESIMSFQPLMLRTWWSRSYYISIDGDLSITRQPGIGWYAKFNFTEIERGD